MSTDTLTYVLSSLKRAAENAYPWSLTPNEAGLLVAEVERLRGERAAVVAYLRYEAERLTEANTTDAFRASEYLGASADDIERGEHRREEEE
jgi:hypothetical protein